MQVDYKALSLFLPLYVGKDASDHLQLQVERGCLFLKALMVYTCVSYSPQLCHRLFFNEWNRLGNPTDLRLYQCPSIATCLSVLQKVRLEETFFSKVSHCAFCWDPNSTGRADIFKLSCQQTLTELLERLNWQVLFKALKSVCHRSWRGQRPKEGGEDHAPGCHGRPGGRWHSHTSPKHQGNCSARCRG